MSPKSEKMTYRGPLLSYYRGMHQQSRVHKLDSKNIVPANADSMQAVSARRPAAFARFSLLRTRVCIRLGNHLNIVQSAVTLGLGISTF